MRKNLLFVILTLLAATPHAQVTNIAANQGLKFETVLANNKAILVSNLDNTLWVSDGTLGGTFQLSSAITYVDDGPLINGKFIFRGSTSATGTELYITDGTTGGTALLKDIYTGTTGSDPDDDFILLNGIYYFTAKSQNEGRELWKTDGTTGGTKLVKDIVTGPTDSNTPNNYNLFSNGTYLLLAVVTVSEGNELWISDGTGGGTTPLKDINPGTASSNADDFFKFNDLVLFTATDAIHGTEIWKTDGTAGGTTRLKDINPNAPSSNPAHFQQYNGLVLFTATDADHGTEIWKTDGTTTDILKDIWTGKGSGVSYVFFNEFNNKVYFSANDSTHGNELWTSDGSGANTMMVKDILPGTKSSLSFLSVFPVGNKFLFVADDSTHGIELWQSNGMAEGTQLFKDIAADTANATPIILPPLSIDINTNQAGYQFFQGNKFFILAKTHDTGYELFVSDGTPDGTKIVKDINPGSANGAILSSFLYTSTAFFFTANDGVHGQELWRTDGTDVGTSMVANINQTPLQQDPDGGVVDGDEGSDPSLFFYLINGKVLFTADDGSNPDNPNATDLFVVAGTFSTLPMKFGDFTVASKNADALLQWSTITEVNTKNFTVERSYDGTHFTGIGTVIAASNSSVKQTYNYTDREIMNSGKETLYYRIVTADKDGKTVDSKIISLKLKGGQWSVKIVSNLVRSDLDLVLTGITENVKVSIKDIGGKNVGINLSTSVNGRISLPISSLNPGMYLLVAESNNERRVLKFVKQ